MVTLPHKLSLLILTIASGALSGCLGAGIGQQLAQSIVMQAADKIASNALEAQERQQAEAKRNIVLKDTAPDEYWGAFVTSNFTSITPAIEPLPDSQKGVVADNTTMTPKIAESKLVKVEVWSLMLGEEKNTVLEKAQLAGAIKLPPTNKWQYWQVATGATKDSARQPIVFLIPPELGRFRSGESAVVELAGLGELNIARYPGN